MTENTKRKSIKEVEGGKSCWITYGYMTGDKSTIVMRSVGMYHDQKPTCETVELPDIGQVSIE